MREIKFRFWDNRLGMMLDMDYVDSCIGGLSVFKKDKNDLIPMQYTGIKDKSGKEIYEGDVLADADELEACVHQIIWDKDKLAFNLLTLSDDEGNWDTGLYDDFHEYQIDGLTKHFDVIGNIYQNPELLS